MHNPFVPETLEGWSILHQMFRVKWPEVRQLSAGERRDAAEQAVAAIATSGEEAGGSALVQLLGHKGDLMLVHFRRTVEDLSAAQLALARVPLFDLLEPTSSYVSVVELGMYDMTAKIHEQLQARRLQQGSEQYDEAFDREMESQRARVNGRLFTEVPRRRHVCFYPMNKRRGELKNWYVEPFADRAAMMREHGMIGRHYAGKVTQIISGSMGLDDWEWGVDLFADDPVVFKKLIHEMRFDRASAEYAEFGPFFVGLQFSPAELDTMLDGRTPALAE
ncbi:MAG TPA: hydrogen peroxide-dependent heme synthase [Vicinamibacterales bacterium]|nr:hydrogen peroxide-dependent heme synthase [Vicinamibacterales bacterium]